MPRTAQDIESYLYRMNRPFDSEGGTYFIYGGRDRPPIALHVADPVVVARVVIGRVPDGEKLQLALFREMLELNASDLAHASYGLDGDEIALTATHELANLDENELDAMLSDLDIALSRQVPKLHELAREKGESS